MTCVRLPVDISQAGEGQLEIMVNRGQVPNSVRQVSKGVYQVSFVPRDIHPHLVDIKFNGEPLPSKRTSSVVHRTFILPMPFPT